MNVTELLKNEDRAVSPVIGVILMVAITVILAAVIGTFVLGLGEQVQQTAPNAQWSFDYDSSGSVLTATHDGGDRVSAPQVAISGSNVVNSGDDFDTVGWGGTDPVSAGDSVTVGPSGNGHTYDWTDETTSDSSTVRIVWTSQSGDQSSTMARWTGPDA